MARLLTGLLILFGYATSSLEAENDEIEIIVIVSTPGTDEYKTLFSEVAVPGAASAVRKPATLSRCRSFATIVDFISESNAAV